MVAKLPAGQYADFIIGLSDFFKKNKIESKDDLSEDELESLCDKVEGFFFHGCLKYPAYYSQDIKDILKYYSQNQIEPRYIESKDRKNYDMSLVANELLKNDFRKTEEEAFKTKTWESSEVE